MLRVRLSAVSRVLGQMRGISTSGSARSQVGFIGLGNMGGPMALNVLKAGHNVVCFDISEKHMEDLAKHGATVASTPAEVAAQAETVITMLPSSPHVQEVYCGSDGVLSTVQSGSLCIDASTIDPSMSKQVAAAAAKQDVKFVDAPVSGGVLGAAAGTLTFMVGGEEKNFKIASQILEAMGKNIVHCGDVGAGQAVKICNNMMLAIHMIGTSETMNLGTKLGIDPKLLAGVLNTSSGRSWSSDTYNPCPGVMEGVPASRGYTGGFGSALIRKDLGLAMSAAKSSASHVPLGQHSMDIYSALCEEGYAEKDFSSVFAWLQNKA